jgi:hypothetical protein
MTFFQYEEQKAGVGPLLVTLSDTLTGSHFHHKLKHSKDEEVLSAYNFLHLLIPFSFLLAYCGSPDLLFFWA